MAFTAVLDTCVLYPFSLRDVLLRLAHCELYLPRWSERILDEMAGNLVEDHRVSEDSATRMRAKMAAAFPDACVSIPDALIDAMSNHLNDRHVAAAAALSGAEVIVTFNLRHFPDDALIPWGTRAIHPDAFLCDLWHMDPSRVFHTLAQLVGGLRKPPMALPDYLALLRRANLPAFADTVETYRREHDPYRPPCRALHSP